MRKDATPKTVKQILDEITGYEWKQQPGTDRVYYCIAKEITLSMALLNDKVPDLIMQIDTKRTGANVKTTITLN